MASASTSWEWGEGVRTEGGECTDTGGGFNQDWVQTPGADSLEQYWSEWKLLIWHCFIRAALLLLLEPVIYRVQPGSNSAAVFLQIILHSSLLKCSLAAEVLQLFEGIRSPSSGGRKQLWLRKSMRACEAGKMSVHHNTLRWKIIF